MPGVEKRLALTHDKRSIFLPALLLLRVTKQAFPNIERYTAVGWDFLKVRMIQGEVNQN